MDSRTQTLKPDNVLLNAPSPLRAALPGAPFSEHHASVVKADAESVWDAIYAIHWHELWLTAPLMMIRVGGRPIPDALGRHILDPGSPMHPVAARQPEVMTSAMIGRPWANDRGRDVADLAEFAAFDEPGWLKYGMEFVLTRLPGGRTYVETSTVCAATDPRSHRRFRAYWTLIRPFSGLIRLDILTTIRAKAEPR